MDIIFEDTAIGGLEGKQVLVPGFDGLEFVFCVLSLSLKEERKDVKRKLNGRIEKKKKKDEAEQVLE